MRAEVRERATQLGLRLAPEATLPLLQDVDTLQVRLSGGEGCRTYLPLALSGKAPSGGSSVFNSRVAHDPSATTHAETIGWHAAS